VALAAGATGYTTAVTHDRCPMLQDVSRPPDGASPDHCLAVWSAGEYERRSRAPLLVHLTL